VVAISLLSVHLLVTMEVSTLETEMRDAKEEIEIEGRLIHDDCELTDAVSGIAVPWLRNRGLSLWPPLAPEKDIDDAVTWIHNRWLSLLCHGANPASSRLSNSRAEQDCGCPYYLPIIYRQSMFANFDGT